MKKEYAVQTASSNLRFGPGVTREVGMDLKDLGLKRVLVMTDSNLKQLHPVQTVLESLESEGIEYDLYSDVRVEPTDISVKKAVAVAVAGNYDA